MSSNPNGGDGGSANRYDGNRSGGGGRSDHHKRELIFFAVVEV
jgi:hypothetical protein